MPIQTTMGNLLVNDVLPDDMRDYSRVLDKKVLTELLNNVAEKYPERYRDISFRLLQIGRDAAQESGGMAFGLEHLRKSVAGTKLRERLWSQLQQILDDDNIDDKKRADMVVRTVGRESKAHQDEVFGEALKSKNPLAQQVLSGARGNRMNLMSLIGVGDLLYADHHDHPIPVPIMHSYSEGLTPSEYWAATYGARRGVMATKFATQDAGFLSKQLNQVNHRLIVVDDDYEDEDQRNVIRGMPVDVTDTDNAGALLGKEAGGYGRNTVLTPKILRDLERQGIKRIIVRSPIAGGSPEGGVYSRDVGIRERSVLPGRGETVGFQAAQALSEPISQGQLSAKHSGGVAGEEKAVTGFQAINQLIQVPKKIKGGAAHSNHDGTVQRIEPAPAGGYFVTINDEPHYVGKGFELRVKKGDHVEAGDQISDGIPNESLITHHKGVGEGKRYFTQAMVKAMRDAGMKVHRRNVEILARGLINHVRLTDEFEDGVPGDIIPYASLEHRWIPRDGHTVSDPRRALGQYLESPILHYSIGTKIRPSVVKDLEEFGVKEITTHKDQPPFAPEMIRGMYNLQHDPDWMARMYGSGQKKSLQDAVHRGGESDELGTSFVPGLARSVDFGRKGLIRPPQPGSMPDNKPDQPKADIAPAKPAPTTFKMPSIKPPRFNLFGKAAEYKQTAHGTLNVPSKPPARPTMNLPSHVPGASSPAPQPGLNGQPNPNPYAVKKPEGLIGTPFGAPLAKSLHKSMPGVGGAVGLGLMLDPKALGTLTRGSGKGPRTYGAAGYEQGQSGKLEFQGQATPEPLAPEPLAPEPTPAPAALPGENPLLTFARKHPDATSLAAQFALSPVLSAGTNLVQKIPGAKNFLSTAVADQGAIGKAVSKVPAVGNVLTGTGRLASGARSLLGGNAAGYALDAVVTGYNVATGQGEQFADDTAAEYRNMLQPRWHSPVTLPLRVLGAVYSPTKNINLISRFPGKVDQAMESADTAGSRTAKTQLDQLGDGTATDATTKEVADWLTQSNGQLLNNSWGALEDQVAQNPELRQKLDHLAERLYQNYLSERVHDMHGLGASAGNMLTDAEVRKHIRTQIAQRVNQHTTAARQNAQVAGQQRLQSLVDSGDVHVPDRAPVRSGFQLNHRPSDPPAPRFNLTGGVDPSRQQSLLE
jgi:hypothetical protein